jgi:hypothetical protein
MAETLLVIIPEVSVLHKLPKLCRARSCRCVVHCSTGLYCWPLQTTTACMDPSANHKPSLIVRS